MTEEPILNIEELKAQMGLGKKETITDIPELISNFVQRKRIERLSKVRIEEIDKIAQMLFFGIRHTAYLNLNNPQISKINYMNIEYSDLKISSILEYTLINLSVRLSEEANSRKDLKEMITGLITKEIELNKENMQNESI